MNSETKNCQNCKTDFTIVSEDFAFYDKMQVPPPTFCFDCRTQRRMAFRNTMMLYKRKCDATGKDVLSIYSPDKPQVVYDQKYWWGDSWDPFTYGRDYDFSRPFFAQWKEFRDTFPMMSVSNSKAVNSDYCNVAEESKDSYLCSACWKIENVLYANRINQVKNSMDLYVVHRSEFCYDDVLCTDSYKLFYSKNCNSCTDSYFLYDCRGCNNCFMSSNLRGASYYFCNEQLSKEEYARKMAEIDFGSFNKITELKKEFKFMMLGSLHKYANVLKCVNVTGNNLENAKNCFYCFDVTEDVEDCKYMNWGGIHTKDSYDCGPGVGMGELMYDTFDTGIQASRNLFTSVVYNSRNIEYSFNCYGCSDCFACLGLRSKQYCIFNKQYSKEDYEILLGKIKQHMNEMPFIDKGGRVCAYGGFFPIEVSPFCYNETVAQDYYPLTKEQALVAGFAWKEKEEKHYAITMKNADIPDTFSSTDESITSQVIECAHRGTCNDRCTTAFRIVADEYNFYKRFNIPIPRLCFGCRHAERLAERLPMKLWTRECMCTKDTHEHVGKCAHTFETPYDPDRQETIYCEECYNKEVL